MLNLRIGLHLSQVASKLSVVTRVNSGERFGANQILALAHGAEIDTRYVGGIERGEENPTVAILGRVAEVLAVHPAELLTELSPKKR